MQVQDNCPPLKIALDVFISAVLLLFLYIFGERVGFGPISGRLLITCTACTFGYVCVGPKPLYCVLKRLTRVFRICLSEKQYRLSNMCQCLLLEWYCHAVFKWASSFGDSWGWRLFTDCKRKKMLHTGQVSFRAQPCLLFFLFPI